MNTVSQVEVENTEENIALSETSAKSSLNPTSDEQTIDAIAQANVSSLPRNSRQELNRLFGSDNDDDDEDEDDDEVVRPAKSSKKFVNDDEEELNRLFGSEGEDDNDEQHDSNRQEDKRLRDKEMSINDFPVFETEFIDSVLPEKEKMYYLRVPNFLDVRSTAFYGLRSHESEYSKDNSGDNVNSHLRVENTLRWRYASSENESVESDGTEPKRESNSRLVQWSDGSWSLQVGKEYFDVQRKSIEDEHFYLAEEHKDIRLFRCQRRLAQKFLIRPHSTASATHRQLTAAIAEKHNKEAKIKVYASRKDPELLKQEMELQEAERLRAQRKLDNMRKEHARKYKILPSELSQKYLEDDMDENEEGAEEYTTYNVGKSDNRLSDDDIQENITSKKASMTRSLEHLRTKRQSDMRDDTNKRHRVDAEVSDQVVGAKLEEGSDHEERESDIVDINNDEDGDEMLVRTSRTTRRAIIEEEEDDAS